MRRSAKDSSQSDLAERRSPPQRPQLLRISVGEGSGLIRVLSAQETAISNDTPNPGGVLQCASVR